MVTTQIANWFRGTSATILVWTAQARRHRIVLGELSGYAGLGHLGQFNRDSTPPGPPDARAA
jgi:hypothetical protein